MAEEPGKLVYVDLDLSEPDCRSDMTGRCFYRVYSRLTSVQAGLCVMSQAMAWHRNILTQCTPNHSVGLWETKKRRIKNRIMKKIIPGYKMFAHFPSPSPICLFFFFFFTSDSEGIISPCQSIGEIGKKLFISLSYG